MLDFKRALHHYVFHTWSLRLHVLTRLRNPSVYVVGGVGLLYSHESSHSLALQEHTQTPPQVNNTLIEPFTVGAENYRHCTTIIDSLI